MTIFLRKLHKLLFHPRLFFRHFWAKRFPPQPAQGARTRALAEGSVQTSKPRPVENIDWLRSVRLARKQETFADALLDAVAHAEHAGRRITAGNAGKHEPLFLGVFPPAFGNPFQNILYAKAPSVGIMPVHLASLDDLAEIRSPSRLACHIHWIGSVLKGAQSLDETTESIGKFVATLDRLKSNATRIVWTAHNVLPHDCRFPEAEISLRSHLASAADIIHIMHPGTVEACSAFYTIPKEKVLQCPHPSYVGVYPDIVGREQARYELNLHPNETVFLAFGSMQPYKGLYELAEIFRDASRSWTQRAHLVIAGMPTDEDLVQTLYSSFGAVRNITIVARRVLPEQIQFLFRAADYAVCPYVNTLNSGVALLAMSFRIPVIGPNQGALGSLVSRGAGLGYDVGDRAGLQKTLREALDFKVDRFGPAIETVLEETRPDVVSRRFAEGLNARLS